MNLIQLQHILEVIFGFCVVIAIPLLLAKVEQREVKEDKNAKKSNR